MSEVREVELEDGILAFDGRVFERFAFGLPGREPTRLHIKEIEEVKLERKRLTGARLTVEGRGESVINASLGVLDDARFAEVESLLEQVRAAAPSLKESG